MLVSLNIKNIVLIDQLLIEFGAGFSALTGETGAGKSILLDSLGLALGYRAEASLVRKGEDQGVATAEFFIDNDHPHPHPHPVHDVLKEQAVESDSCLILKRVLSADGRSRAFINDQPVSVGLLKRTGNMLVEIHGQFETQGLLDAKLHRAMLDDYAEITPNHLATLYEGMSAAQRNLDDAQKNIQDARAEEDYIRESLHDIDSLEPKEGEEASLSELRDRLMNKEKFIQALDGAYRALSEEGGAESGLNAAWRALDKVSGAGDDVLQPVLDALDRAGAELQEAAAHIQSASSKMDDAEYNLQEIDDRLFALRAQARKHACEIDDLIRIRSELADKLDLIEKQDIATEELIKKRDQARKDYLEEAKRVSAKRHSAAGKLDALITAELPPLKLDKARFVTDIQTDEAPEHWSSHGIDKISFLVSTNPGRDPGPLNKIASGGEMSRFMLALKVVMANVGHAPTMIFDEVDAGVGGSTAAAVGERLKRLAADKQILVVTHAPQVAALADHHHIVQKAGNDDVKTTVITLSEHTKRREEIARMISGANVTEEARAAADKLMDHRNTLEKTA